MGFITRRVKKTGHTLGDWLGLSLMVNLAILMKEIFVDVFFPWKREPAGPVESFEEAIARLKLTEEDIEQRKSMFLKQTFFFMLAGFAVIAYGITLAMEHAITGTLMCLLISTVAFSNAFRMHFWYFQTKHRKLGCTFQEWLNSSLKG